MPTDTAPDARLANLLAAAHQSRKPVRELAPELLPTDSNAAFDVQQRTLALLKQPIAGWKVGAKSSDGPVQGAPLPADRVLHSGATLRRADYAVLGLELEIAFRFDRVFDAGGGPYSDETVLGAVSSMLATIEIVSSRFAEWPAVDKLAQLADLMNHGALVCGEAVPYSSDFAFEAPSLEFTFEGVDIVKGRVANPAGDPRRVLGWVVNHCAARRIPIGGDVVVTAGSFTGLHFPNAEGTAVGKIEGLPPVRLTLA